MRILAIDTTSTFGSIALTEGDAEIEQLPLHSPEGFSQVLFEHLERVLKRHDWTVDSIGCFAAASGPGSFTGVRVGLTAAKGLAEATGRPAVAVSNLEALAACGTGELRGVVMDARRGEVYGAVYDRELRTVMPEIVMPFRVWLETLPNVDEILSPDFSPFRASFRLNVRVTEERAIATAVARIAYARMARGETPDPASSDANYVRRSDAELNWVDR
jgi:tRNA threonylcarbamoyladenosine biosynthesis protein TsaB